MTFIEAVEWIKKGYYIRRSWWLPESIVTNCFYDFNRELCWVVSGWETYHVTILDALANDWEVKPWEDGFKRLLPYPEEKIAHLEKETIQFNKWRLGEREKECLTTKTKTL